MLKLRVDTHPISRTLGPLGVAFTLLLTGVVGCTGPTDRAERGRVLYGYCAQCHGADARGLETYRAPALSHLDAWYIEAQLMKFRTGARGDHPDDLDGLRMRPMARTLASSDEVRLVAEYVADLPEPEAPSPSTLGGDPGRGRALYEPCVQCHGEQARGNPDTSAPRLTLADDWYLAAQIRKFQAGVRGADPQDNTGGQMRAMATSLSDEQAILDVVAYISTLK